MAGRWCCLEQDAAGSKGGYMRRAEPTFTAGSPYRKWLALMVRVKQHLCYAVAILNARWSCMIRQGSVSIHQRRQHLSMWSTRLL